MVNFIEFPIFDGVSGDLRPWISELEDFFVREKFTADEKMNLAQSLLEGEAYAWFYRQQKILIFQSWEDLKDNLWLMFGDFADLDRLLQKHRDDAKLRRMSRTAIAPHESISSPATIHEPVPVDKVSNQQVDEISGEKKDESHEATLVKVLDSLEDESITQTQVPVFSLEPGLSFSSESLDVSVAWPSEMVRINRVHSQAGVECVKNKNNAHHVLDELLLRRHKFQPRKKPSLSPKSRMFKFKNRTLSPCFSANFGLVRQKRTFQCLRLPKHAHMSRVLYQMRMLHDPGGMQRLLHGDMKPMAVKPMGVENQTPVVFRMAISSFCPLFSEETSKPWGTHMTFTGYDGTVDGIRCLEIGVCSGIKQPIDSRRASRVWERGGLDISADLTDWLMKCYKGFEFSRLMRQLHKIDLQWVRRKDLEDLCVGQGLLRLSNQLKYNYASVREDWFNTLSRRLLGFNVVYFRCHKEYGLARLINWSQVRVDYSLMQGKLFCTNSLTRNMSSITVIVAVYDGTIQIKRCGETARHICFFTDQMLQPRILTKQILVKECDIDWDKVEAVLEQIIHWDNEAYTKSIALHSGLGENVHILPAADVNELQFIPECVFGKSFAEQMFHRQQNSSSIWHRWRRKPLFLLHFWKKNCWYQRLFLLSGLC